MLVVNGIVRDQFYEHSWLMELCNCVDFILYLIKIASFIPHPVPMNVSFMFAYHKNYVECIPGLHEILQGLNLVVAFYD